MPLGRPTSAPHVPHLDPRSGAEDGGHTDRDDGASEGGDGTVTWDRRARSPPIDGSDVNPWGLETPSDTCFLRSSDRSRRFVVVQTA